MLELLSREDLPRFNWTYIYRAWLTDWFIHKSVCERTHSLVLAVARLLTLKDFSEKEVMFRSAGKILFVIQAFCLGGWKRIMEDGAGSLEECRHPPISCLRWNCRGLGNDATVKELRDLMKQFAPSVLCVLETQVHKARVEQLKTTLGFDFSFAVNSTGRCGGLVIF